MQGTLTLGTVFEMSGHNVTIAVKVSQSPCQRAITAWLKARTDGPTFFLFAGRQERDFVLGTDDRFEF